MNPYQAIEAARPAIPPMPPIARRHLREHLFGIATRSQTSLGDPHVTTPNTARGNAARLAALAMLGIAGVGGLAYSASRGTGANDTAPTPGTTVPVTAGPSTTRATVLQPPPPTIAPTTTAAPIAGTEETPLLLPIGRRRLDELSVVRGALGGSSLLLRAPDLSTIALQERDGIAPPPPEPPTTDDTGTPVTTVPPTVIGALSITQAADPGVYEVSVPCGSVVVREGAEAAPFRPEIVELFSAMSVDGGTIGISLPAGWGVIGAGPSTDEFTFALPVDIDGNDVTVRLRQYPNGNLAAAGFGHGPFAPATFLGQPAWVSHGEDDFEVIGLFGTTAYRLGARGATLEDVEAVVETFEPGDVDEWITRFGALPAAGDPDIRVCGRQPEFAVTSA